MDDDMHMYEIVGYQGEGHKLNDGTKQTTSIDDEEEYVSLHDPSYEESSARYQVPCAQGGTSDIRTTVTNDEPEVKGSSDCQVQKKRTKANQKMPLCTEFTRSYPFSDDNSIFSLGSICFLQHRKLC